MARAILESIANELKNIRKILEKRSTTEESSMVGEWIVADDESILFTVYKCSRCGKVHAQSPHNYCPNCGAKMKGADNE